MYRDTKSFIIAKKVEWKLENWEKEDSKYIRDSLGKVKRGEDRIKSLSSLYICHIYKYTYIYMYVLMSISLKNIANKLCVCGKSSFQIW